MALLALLACVFGIARVGADSHAVALVRFAFVFEALLSSGVIAAVYLVAALGLGRFWRPMIRRAAHPWSAQFGLGLATALWLDHTLGWVGLLTNQWVAWLILACGLTLLLDQLRKADHRPEQWSSLPPTVLLVIPALAMLLVACASLPGWLWPSEAHGYDVLEYHLQLPAEWLRAGRISGMEHNVYSFFPSYVEAAYLHLGSLWGSMFAGKGLILRAAQFLHAGLAIATVMMLGRFITGELAPQRGRVTAGLSAGLGAAFLMLTPWVIVVASMAYNEMAVTALFVAAVIVSCDAELPAYRKLSLVGVLVGVACGAKLTSLFMVGLPVAVLLLAYIPIRLLVRAVPLGVVGALLALGPALMRNMLDAGNPLFPFASNMLGRAHWTAEQAARWSGAHHFDGSFSQRLVAMWERGVAHPQWSIFFAVVLVAAVISIIARSTRRMGIIWSAVLILQLVCWASFTHVQARFLIPVIIPAGILIACAVSLVSGISNSVVRRFVLIGCCLITIPPLAATYQAYRAHWSGDPGWNVSADAFDSATGAAFVDRLRAIGADQPPPRTVINFALPPDALVYMLGDATPLYCIRPVLYHTTWDHSPLGELLRAYPDNPVAWSTGLADRGVTHVLVNFSELARLQSDGWYDADVTPARVERLMRDQGTPIVVNGSTVLFQLK